MEIKDVGPFIRNIPLGDCVAGPMTGDDQSSFNEHHSEQSALFNEEVLFNRLTSQWLHKKDRVQTGRDDVRQLAKHIVVDALTMDWLCDDMQDAHLRVYLIDQILPPVVLGLEKLLAQVDKRALIDLDKMDSNFNPVNFLAQFLMRNNPKYSNFGEASIYVRGLRKVSEHLKLELFHMTDNRLTGMKDNAHKRRAERELEVVGVGSEMNRRKHIIEQQFYEWNAGEKVELSLIQNALRTFPEDVKQFTKPLDPTDETMKVVYLADYITYLLQFVGTTFIKSSFDQLAIHISHCIQIHQRLCFLHRRGVLYTKLFHSCDPAKGGQLDRHRLLTLLDLFYAKVSPDIRDLLARPIYEIAVAALEVNEEYKDIDENDEEEDEKEDDNENEIENENEIDTNLIESESELRNTDSFENNEKELTSSSNQLDAISLSSHHDVEQLIASNFLKDENELDEEYHESQQSVMSHTVTENVDMSLRDHGLFAFVLDGNVVSLSQFIQLLELFLHLLDDDHFVSQFINYIREGFMHDSCGTGNIPTQTVKNTQNDEIMKKLSDLFIFLDNDSSGYIKFEFMECALLTHSKDNAINAAKLAMKEQINFEIGRLNKIQFSEFMSDVINRRMDSNDMGDGLIECLYNSVIKTREEIERGELRRQWLASIESAGKTSFYSMQPVYNELFRALYKDALKHGNGKIISAAVALLKQNNSQPGKNLLLFVASTSDQADLVLGKALYEDMKGITFECIATGKPLHIPNVTNHGNIHFWNENKKLEENKGSYVVVPLQKEHGKVFGIIEIDTINSKNELCKKTDAGFDTEQEHNVFTHHEIDFYQGLSEAFSLSYHVVEVRQSCLHACRSAMSWLLQRCMHIEHIDVYMVQSLTYELLLYISSTANKEEQIYVNTSPVRMLRKDNIFRDYLFKCSEVSEPVMAKTFGHYNFAVPLRDDKGITVTVLDINIGDGLAALPTAERQQFISTVQLLQAAVLEITMESSKPKETVLPAEALFEHLMLRKVHDKLDKLDDQAFSELKSEAENNVLLQNLVKTAAMILLPESDDLVDWQYCIQFIEEQHGSKLLQFDPVNSSLQFHSSVITFCKDVHYEDILNCNNQPACIIFDWLILCMSLMTSEAENKNASTTYAYHVETDILADYCNKH